MRKLAVAVFIIAGISGCRSPQIVMQQLETCNTCFADTSTPSQSVPVETASEDGTVEEYVQLGLQRNPRLQEAQHRIEAIRHRVPQVLSLPDPTVNTTTHLAPVETAAGRQAFALGVSQKFTNAERRATKAAIVNDEVVAAEAELVKTRLEIAEQIRTACYQLLFVRKSIEISKEDAESLAQIAEVIERQYEVKQSVTQQDLLNVQIEQSKIENQITELQQREKSFQARLARLLHVDSSSELQIIDQLQTQSSQLNVESLIATAIQLRPDLQSQIANVNRDQKKIHLASLESKPDFTLGLNWIATSDSGISPVANGDDALLLGVGFNLPVYKSRIRAGICEAQANRRASQSKLESLQDMVAEEVFDLVAKLESNQQTMDLIRNDIIPKAQRTLDLSIDEYATNEVQYVQLIANWRTVLRYRVAEANLQSQHGQLLASLARSVGQLEPIASAITATVEQPEFEDAASPAELQDSGDDSLSEEADGDGEDASDADDTDT